MMKLHLVDDVLSWTLWQLSSPVTWFYGRFFVQEKRLYIAIIDHEIVCGIFTKASKGRSYKKTKHITNEMESISNEGTKENDETTKMDNN